MQELKSCLCLDVLILFRRCRAEIMMKNFPLTPHVRIIGSKRQCPVKFESYEVATHAHNVSDDLKNCVMQKVLTSVSWLLMLACDSTSRIFRKS